MKVKRVLILAGAALLTFFLVTQPEGAASIVNTILGGIREAFEAIITFVRGVFHA